MLLELSVSHFAIIDNIRIRFQGGLNILSGETGAGKSVLLKSLGLLMGDKSSSDVVRSGHEQAIIEGFFDISHRSDIHARLQNLGIPTSDGELVVRRLINSAGKSKVYINECLSTLQALQNLVSPLIEVTGQAVPLIEMTGQHENKNLMSKSYHLDLLDYFAGNNQLRGQYYSDYTRWKALADEIDQIEEESRNRAQRLDFLKFQRDEIKALNLQPGEESELQAIYDRTKNASRLAEWATQSEQALLGDDDSAIVRLHRVIQKGLELRKYDSAIESRLVTLQTAKSAIEEFVFDMRGYQSQLESTPESLDEIESRMSGLRKLQKKYGSTVEDILKALESFEKEIRDLETADERLELLKKEQVALELALKKRAHDLHTRREKSSSELAKKVNDELSDLNMKGVTLTVSIKSTESLSSSGMSEVEFMTQSSAKDQPRPLAKFASGGELSRILLSLKHVIGVGEFPRSYLFDEVDTGVSGPTAEKVGRKLKTIADGQQVICVTHLPQVACFADHHYYIHKLQNKNGVQMQIKELNQSEKVDEIARLISGEKITKTSLAHAKQLLSLE